METTYFLQGERMDLTAGSLQIPVAMLNVFNGTIVLVLIPVLDRFVYPCFQRFKRPLSNMHRI
ncbi:solute carrier family 15 member 4, partial [Biomphalaria pfeifferi]